MPLTSLQDIVIQKINDKGPISFHDFMEMALYYPKLGYYTNDNEKTGKYGDFYTSPYLTSLFGAMIGKQMEEMWNILGKGEFTIVEYGAGNGMLCNDILLYLKENNIEMYEMLSYCIIEKSPYMLQKEKDLLLEKVSWHNNISELSPITGCILSNELLDNFSVHQVVMQKGLKEVFVDHDDDFKEILLPANDILLHYLDEQKVSLSNGFRTEINTDAESWLKEISNSLRKGFILTIDYGHTASDFFDQRRRNGTLICYYKHMINNCPYTNIGEQDITSHVNFSALHQWGKENDLINCGFTDQARFLLSLGLTAHLHKIERDEQFQYIDDKKKQFLLNTLLIDMGKKFKVLSQSKDVSSARLSGMRFLSMI